MASTPGIANVTDFAGFAKLRADARANDPEALRTAARQFEAMFTQMLLKTAHSQSQDGGSGGDLLGGSDSDVYRDLYDQQMAQQISAGKGLGLADMLVNQLRGLSSSSSSASQTASAAALARTASASAPAANWLPKSEQEIVAAIRPHAEKAAAELGVPARMLIAQAALETGWGQHLPRQADGSASFNLFGIKAGSGWTGASTAKATSEFDGSGWSRQTASFRAYGSIGHAFEDYVGLLKNNPRYAPALSAGSSAGFAQGLQRAGYATDPDYAQKLLKIANSPEMSAALSPARSMSV